MNKNKKLFIVAGSAGEIGGEFCRILVEQKEEVIAIVRNRPVEITSQYLTSISCDLTDSRSIETSMEKNDFSKYGKITFIHTIGTDKYDPRGYPETKKMRTIDPGVYDTNVNTFKYPLRYLTSILSKIRANGTPIIFKVVMIGGIPDKFTPFVIEGFCEAKNICREYIRSAVSLFPDWISGLSINISSTITRAALQVRPHADLTYWLKPEEVVQCSIESLCRDETGFSEIEVFKSSPDFRPGYYEDPKALYEKWSHDTGTSA